MKKSKPTLEIAGAGSGKTSRLIKRILESTPSLNPARYLAAITYTNSATEEIRERLKHEITIPPNVFIGTTLAFINKFIVLPYSSLVPKIKTDNSSGKQIESLITEDKIFFELNETTVTNILNKGVSWSSKSPSEKKQAINMFINNQIRSGKIPFDKIASIGEYLIKNSNVRNIVGNRLQYLFIDEFQDASNSEFAIFDQLRIEGKTTIYTVGDAEQYITNFRAKKDDFKKIPIIEHQSKYSVEKKTINNRSSSQLVTFINNFNTQLQQEAIFSTVTQNTISFITKTDLDSIISVFQTKTSHWKEEIKFQRFYLAHENKTFDSVKEKFGLLPKTNDSKKPKSILSDIVQIIRAITGLSNKQLYEHHKINPLQLRVHAYSLWNQSFKDVNEFKNHIETKTPFKINDQVISIPEQFETLLNLKQRESNVNHVDYYSTIHKAKGLEATCVLVVAKSNKELSKWLEKDHNRRIEVKYGSDMKAKTFEDTYRLGFVAFSRAKLELCIACLEKLSDENKKLLASLKVPEIDV